MKWRTKRQGYEWYTGPAEGWDIYYAAGKGRRYEVQAAWCDNRTKVVWWCRAWPAKGHHDGSVTSSRAYRTKADAIAAAERQAAGEGGAT